MEVLRYLPEHMQQMDLQDGQAYLASFITQEHMDWLTTQESYTIVHEGEVLFIGGLTEPWAGRAQVWAYLGRTAGKHLRFIHKQVLKFLALYDGMRVETTVDEDFQPGHRWVKMLGFECETPKGMRAYRPEGTTHYLYSRVKNG